MNERGERLELISRASERVMFNNRDVTISLCKVCENIQTTTIIMFSVVRWLEQLILMFSCFNLIYLAQIKLVHVCWDMSNRVPTCVTVWAITSSWVSRSALCAPGDSMPTQVSSSVKPYFWFKSVYCSITTHSYVLKVYFQDNSFLFNILWMHCLNLIWNETFQNVLKRTKTLRKLEGYGNIG